MHTLLLNTETEVPKLLQTQSLRLPTRQTRSLDTIPQIKKPKYGYQIIQIIAPTVTFLRTLKKTDNPEERLTKDRESDTAILYPLSTELNIPDTESADNTAIDCPEDSLKKATSTTAEATEATEATTAEATKATTAEVTICTPYPVTRTGYYSHLHPALRTEFPLLIIARNGALTKTLERRSPTLATPTLTAGSSPPHWPHPR